jgi:hypothetical protein
LNRNGKKKTEEGTGTVEKGIIFAHDPPQHQPHARVQQEGTQRGAGQRAK